MQDTTIQQSESESSQLLTFLDKLQEWGGAWQLVDRDPEWETESLDATIWDNVPEQLKAIVREWKR